MADDPNTNFKTGDDEYNIWRKILARLNLGITTSGGGGGGGGGGGAVTVADGADVTQGAKADAAATDSTSSWSVVSALKGIFAKLAGTLTTSVSNFPATQPVSGTIAVSNFPATQPVSGTVAVSTIGAGAAVIGHVIADTGSTTAVTSLPALPAGANVIGHVIVDSGTVTTVGAVTAITNALPAGTNVIGHVILDSGTVTTLTSGNVGGFTAGIKDTTVVSTTPAYTAGDAVGAKRTLANAVRVSGGTGIIDSIVLLDRANQKAGMELLIFDADPTNATITDNAAFVYSTDDLKVIARITIGASDYVTLNSKAIACLRGLGIAFKTNATTSLFAALVTTGTPTFAATTDVQLTVGILQD
jgi:hypothetical protein